MNCLFLGYNSRETRLIKFLKKKNISVKNIKKNLSLKEAKKADIIISFGYKKLLKIKVIKAVRRPIINLHMSYLPYNRGAHPNYWSFIDNTPRGVTIHEIDAGIDTGNIIIQKKIKLNIISRKLCTFKKTYNYLLKSLEKLFMDNFKMIINNNYKSFKQKGKSTFHKKSQLHKELKKWDTNILQYKKRSNKIN